MGADVFWLNPTSPAELPKHNGPYDLADLIPFQGFGG